jgi:hypothetical protein
MDFLSIHPEPVKVDAGRRKPSRGIQTIPSHASPVVQETLVNKDADESPGHVVHTEIDRLISGDSP